MQVLMSFLGLGVFIFFAYLISENKKRFPWRIVLSALALQFFLAIFLLKITFVRTIFKEVAGGIVYILSFSDRGAEFLFGKLLDFEFAGFVLAFKILPTIIFFSALSALLYHFKILPKIVALFAVVMRRALGLSGVECTAAAANVFLGQTEAPLLVRPYLEKMSRSELMSLMTGGMATIAGAVLAAYVDLLGGDDVALKTEFATHLLVASIISAPSALMIAKVICPETKEITQSKNFSLKSNSSNMVDAVTQGTTEGLKLAVNVGAMLLVFTALMAMCNQMASVVLGDWMGLNSLAFELSEGLYEKFDLSFLLGLCFSPLSFLIGVTPEDCLTMGRLLGTKIFLNEFIAYQELASFQSKSLFQDPKSIIVATYALCGFSNFASIGIQVGGIGVLVPGRRPLLSQLAFKAMLGGTLACLMTAAVASILI